MSNPNLNSPLELEGFRIILTHLGPLVAFDVQSSAAHDSRPEHDNDNPSQQPLNGTPNRTVVSGSVAA